MTTLCLSDEDGLDHIDSLLKPTYTAKDMATLGFEEANAKSVLLLNRVFRVQTDQTGQFLDIELGLDMTPHHQRIRMQREHQDSEFTTRETTRQVGVRLKKESNSEEIRCNTIQICVHETFPFGP